LAATTRWLILTTPEDIEKLMEFDTLCFIERDRVSFEEYINWLAKGLKIYVLEDIPSGEWIGSFQIVPEFDEGTYFAGFAVRPNYRRAGFSRVIMNYMIEHFNQTTDLVCKTRRKNFIMIQFLKSYGFENKLVDITGPDVWTWWVREPKVNDRIAV
jgi:GNAT superfamily N-acetyltransferase